jgi:predicted aspartyl protease
MTKYRLLIILCNAVIGISVLCVPTVASSGTVTPPGPLGPSIAIPPASIDETLEITGESVAGRQLNSRMTVPVRVNGHGPYRFVVDSGADRTVISRKLADTLGLPLGGDVTLYSVVGASRVQTVQIDHIAIGTTEVEAIQAPALDERDLGAQGLLGIDALADHRLLLDFDRKEIVVQDASVRMRALPDEIVVTARRRNGQLILTEAQALGSRVSAVIDTGAQVTIGNAALRARLPSGRRSPKVARSIMTSVTGATLSVDLVQIREMRIGGIIFSDVTIAFSDSPVFALFGLSHEPAILLGTDLLESFRRVSLDFRRRKVRFQLRRDRQPAPGRVR